MSFIDNFDKTLRENAGKHVGLYQQIRFDKTAGLAVGLTLVALYILPSLLLLIQKQGVNGFTFYRIMDLSPKMLLILLVYTIVHLIISLLVLRKLDRLAFEDTMADSVQWKSRYKKELQEKIVKLRLEAAECGIEIVHGEDMTL